MTENKQINDILRRLWEDDYSDDYDGHHQCIDDYQKLEGYIIFLEKLDKKHNEDIDQLQSKLREEIQRNIKNNEEHCRIVKENRRKINDLRAERKQLKKQIEELKAEIEEANTNAHWWKSRFNGASNGNKILREEYERLKKYEKNWEDLRKRLQNGFVNLHTDFKPDCDLVNWGSGTLAVVLGVMDELESEGKKE